MPTDLARGLPAFPPIADRYFVHPKSGGFYELVCTARRLDGTPVVVYRSMANAGLVWIRDAAEFADGRFAPVAVALALQGAQQAAPLADDLPPLPGVSARFWASVAPDIGLSVEVIALGREEATLEPAVVSRRGHDLADGHPVVTPAAEFVLHFAPLD